MSVRPEISVLIPAHNERSRIAPTIQSIARARTTDARLEFIVIDDASEDGCISNLISTVPQLLEEPGIEIRVCRLEERSGNYQARNQAAALASADIFFITDAHVKFSPGWDECVFNHIAPDRILAGTVTQEGTDFRGYGCDLLVPLMGTVWNRVPAEPEALVPVSVCSATVIPRELFHRLGGYDPDMILYGAGDPEFSIRAWLFGAEICALAALEVQHEFKPREEFSRFLESVRLYWVHNCIRFGLLYLSELGCMQMLRYHALAYPALFQSALDMVDRSNVWMRRAYLEKHRQHSFDWFVGRFALKNQIGGEII
jgi:glycosyltransferase involved in cell wall biosynthesis